MDTFPYYDKTLRSWIYDILPDSVELATDEKILRIGTKILFKPTEGRLEKYFISAVISSENIAAARQYLKKGLVYIKKNGI